MRNALAGWIAMLMLASALAGDPVGLPEDQRCGPITYQGQPRKLCTTVKCPEGEMPFFMPEEGGTLYTEGCTRLVVTKKVSPGYPDAARRKGVTGHVVLRGIVSPEGRPEDLEVATVSQSGVGFEEAAISAVKEWTYKPALWGSTPVPTLLVVRVDFTAQ